MRNDLKKLMIMTFQGYIPKEEFYSKYDALCFNGDATVEYIAQGTFHCQEEKGVNRLDREDHARVIVPTTGACQ